MNREVKNIVSILTKPSAANDLIAIQNGLAKLIALSNEGKDITSALGCIVKLLSVQDLVSKKLASVLIIRSKEKIGDLSLLIQNTLRQDFSDPNPIVRKIALKTLCACSCQAVGHVDYLNRGLRDASPYVRRSAVLHCISLYKHDPEVMLNHGFVNRLYEMLRDSDCLVVSNCLVALEEILSEEGGVVINHNIACHLLNQLPSLAEWGQIEVLSLLRKYKPKTETEVFDILNILDPLLHNKNCSVVINTVILFLDMLSDHPHLKEDVFKRASSQLASFLNNSSSPEKMYLLLEFVQDHISDYPRSFQALYRSMFCHFSEPAHIKLKKLEILTKLSTEDNVQEVLDEISMHCTNSVEVVSKGAIAAIGVLAKAHPSVFELCIGKVIQILTLEQESLTGQILFLLQDLDMRRLEKMDDLIEKLQCCHRILKREESKCAFLWLLGELGSAIPDAPYILENYIHECGPSSGGVLFKNSILITALKLFFKRPAECQMLLGRIFEVCHQDANKGIRNQVDFYYKLLSSKVDIARQIASGLTSAEIETLCKQN